MISANNNDERKRSQMETNLITDNVFRELEGDI